VEKLDKRRYDVTLLCGPGGEWLGRAHAAGIQIIFIDELIRKIHVLVDFMALLKIYKIIKRGKYSVVHTHSSKPGFSGRIAARLAGVPVVIHTIHGFPFHDFMPPLLKKGFIALERFLSRFADRLVTVSLLNQEKAIRLGLNKSDKFVNIYSGICFNRFDRTFDVRDIKKMLGTGRDEKIVGMVGRLSAQKSPLTFLEAVPLILAASPEARFILVGDGELRPEVEAYIRRHHLEQRVKLLGFREDVPRIIAAIDVFVLSSLWEGLGRSLTEALYMSKPAVAAAVEGVPELIENGVTGLLIPPKDPAALARGVIYMLQNPAEAAKMGKAARQTVVELFSAERMVREIDHLYTTILMEKGQ